MVKNVDFPYHGGQVSGDIYSCIFGTQITDNDGNRNYTNEIRNAKESDYENDFKIFLDNYLKELEDIDRGIKLDSQADEEIPNIQGIIDFIKSETPCFYSIEASS